MARVSLWGSLRAAVDGAAEIEVEANDVAGLLRELADRYPGLRPQLKRGVSVSIDGVVHSRTRVASIPPGAEVVLLPRIEGG
jgi:molybdopterin converting factor small subunit